ncbi:MAG TPA: 4-hydroxythreonine-4-phosphate dehydrogenase PdxA [Cyclobacteriaceae bacterium]|nr:4-hydroxythreonine-4-phosphate dehydrogenase PdxA [Cyclobacteriaceae bacterium]
MIGITIGDASGVGPEILVRAYHQNCIPGKFIAIGDQCAIEFAMQQLSLDFPINKIRAVVEHRNDYLNVIDMKILSQEEITPGKISKNSGNASLSYIERGTNEALRKNIHALVTLPVNKEAVRLSSPDFSGHTGYIAELCKSSNYTMMLVSKKLIVTHVSTHISLTEAISKVKSERICNVISMTHEALKKIRSSSRIAVAGLNPHAGEGGAFGQEEITEIRPAVEKARREGIDVAGPFPPDTIFHQAVNGIFDAVVCMYHDQGHIPMKLLDFDGAVNVTLGLPIIRTSVDHGTAFDIAYKGTASLNSFINALTLAEKFCNPGGEK